MVQDSPPDSTDPDLRDRVAELEATVEQQQATIQQLLPSRRRVLQAGGLLAGGGVLGALTADRASGQPSGQVGTRSDPVDVEAYDLAVQNQLSSSIDAGGNDFTKVGSVSTNQAIYDDASLGNSYLSEFTPVDSDHEGGEIQNFVDGVSTSAQTILNLNVQEIEALAAFALVQGTDANDAGNRFTDLVHIGQGGAGDVAVVSGININSPPTRTYSLGGGTGSQLQLVVGSGTVNIGVRGTALRAL